MSNWQLYDRRSGEDEAERRRLQVTTAAEREAADIVDRARSDIRRIIVKARRELLELAAQIQAVTAKLDESAPRDEMPASTGPLGPSGMLLSPTDGTETRNRVLRFRQDVRSVLDCVQPDLARLQEAALLGGVGPEAREGTGLGDSRVLLDPPDPYDRIEVGVDVERFPRGRFPSVPAVTVMVAGLLVLAGGAWWFRNGRQQVVPQAARPAPRTEPSPPKVADRDTRAVGLPQVAAAPASRAGLSLLVQARRSAWIRTTTDGHSEDGRVFKAGEQLEIHADREVSLRVGDAGAVLVSVNGAAAEPLGRDGEVITRRFEEKESRNPSIDTEGASRPPDPPPDAARGTTNRSALPVDRPAPPTSAAGARAGSAGVPALATVSAGRGGASVAPPQPPASAAVEPELATAAERWLDAYYRSDSGRMAAVAAGNMTVSDERTPGERLPPGLGAVRRGLERVTVQLVGESAILTARMTEQSDADQSRSYKSWISQIWIREGSRFRLLDVRLLSDAKLK
jgi:hypothetical protein